MLNPNDSIFKYEDWLDNNKKDPSYNYYFEITKNRKEILGVMGTPYFEEIRQRTKGIQDKLKKGRYEDIDLELKSLFIDGIEFFLNLDTDEPQLDNKKWLYLKGLFDSLMINTENKNLLKKILSELKEGGEKLPPSPIDFLVNYQYSQSEEKQRPKPESKDTTQEDIKTPKKDELERILENYRNNPTAFKKFIGADELDIHIDKDTLESLFLQTIYLYILVLLGEGDTDSKYIFIDKKQNELLDNYISSHDKSFLEFLKVQLEKEEIIYCMETNEEINWRYEPEELDIMRLKRRKERSLVGKEIMKGHCAYNDSPDKVRIDGKNVVMYNVGDEYVPCDNYHSYSIELLEKINKSSDYELEQIFIEKAGEGRRGYLNVLREKGDNSIINFIKGQLPLLYGFPDIIGMYNKGDRFVVVNGTYNDTEIKDSKKISCWYVDIRSEKTGKTYRVLSE